MKYEYLVIPIPEQNVTVFELTTWLNKMGSKEWQLTIVTDINHYFMREIATNEKLRKIQLKEVSNNDDENDSC
jgi:hypothetical protein